MILDFCNDSSVFRPTLIGVSNGGGSLGKCLFLKSENVCVNGWMHAEIGLQVSFDSVNSALYLFHNWGPHSYQGAAIEAADRSQSSWSLEPHSADVFYFLPQYCVRQCKLEIHPCILHANHQVLHTCDYRCTCFFPLPQPRLFFCSAIHKSFVKYLQYKITLVWACRKLGLLRCWQQWWESEA